MKRDRILGIELGSTRIKAVLIDETYGEIAAGSYQWENRYENGFWTYDQEAIWKGLQRCYRRMAEDYTKKFSEPLTKISAIGISGMMHGYLAFDEEDQLLVPFRTWRNTNTERAAKELTELFSFPIPHRWSIAHFYQAVLNREAHVSKVRYMTTLAGYVHWKLTGRKVLGIGDASGMFPIDGKTGTYDAGMMTAFDDRIKQEGIQIRCQEILPAVCKAGEAAGTLTKEGASLLDTTGNLLAGSILCPPEGDAGTGMTAANAVRPCTGNISAGTSIFAMIVLDQPLRKVYPEIDLVTTPEGIQTAMVHCNNGTSEINAWAALFQELLQGMGVKKSDGELYPFLFQCAAAGDGDCGGVLCCNYHSGEPIAKLPKGIPMAVHRPDGRLNLQNFMRAQLYAAAATLKIGFEILQKEKIHIDYLTGHGGLFKTPKAGQQILSAALKVPVCTMEHAGEGGAWGIALLAAYSLRKKENETNKTYKTYETLDEFLQQSVFKTVSKITVQSSKEEQRQYESYMKEYHELLEIERTAVAALCEDRSTD